jgi:hypothetical protein
MTTNILYVPTGRVIDLAKPLSPADTALIGSLRGEIQRGDRTLLCQAVRGGVGNRELFIRINPHREPGHYTAVHFRGTPGHGTHPIEPETIEHQRQKEYVRQAATDAGLTAETEVPVSAGSRHGVMDVAITGGTVDADIEVQRNRIGAATVTRRTRLYHAAGYLPVWFNDWGPRPEWLGHVPALGCSPRDWEAQMPRRRTVTATGLGTLREAACRPGEFDRCPMAAPRQRGTCGGIHPKVTAGLPRYTVDDVAAMVPAGELVPLRYFNSNAFLVTAGTFTRYQEMTDGLGAWHPGPAEPPPSGYQRSRECANPHNGPGQAGTDVSPRSGELAEVPDLAGLIEAQETGLSDDLDDVYAPAAARARVRREQPYLADLPVLIPGYCPGCRTARLTHGRKLCQACSLLMIMGRPPAGIA